MMIMMIMIMRMRMMKENHEDQLQCIDTCVKLTSLVENWTVCPVDVSCNVMNNLCMTVSRASWSNSTKSTTSIKMQPRLTDLTSRHASLENPPSTLKYSFQVSHHPLLILFCFTFFFVVVFFNDIFLASKAVAHAHVSLCVFIGGNCYNRSRHKYKP